MPSVLKIVHIATAMLPLFIPDAISWDWTLAFTFVFKQPLKTLHFTENFLNFARKHIDMTRFLTIILLVLMGVTASRADVLPQLKREKPDLDSIRIATLDRTSPYYYPRLMAEVQRNDTLMKIDKYRYLYLGYMVQ